MTVFDTASNIVNSALQELGLPAVSLSNASDATGYQALGLLNALGREILRVHDWQNLEQTMTFVGDGVNTSFDLPDNYGRQVNQTEWSVSDRRPLLGPDSPQVWSWNKYGIISVGVYFRYRLLHNKYEVFPVPGDGTEFALYYISKNWVQDADDEEVFKDKIDKADDIPLFDSQVLIAGLKVKFWGQKGFDTTILQNEFDYLLTSEKGQNQGARVINLSNNDSQYLIGWYNVPDGTYYGN